jgi:hypothetical protein
MKLILKDDSDINRLFNLFFQWSDTRMTDSIIK